jgi:hypothetical protein
LRAGISYGAASVKIELREPGGDNNLVGCFNQFERVW